MKNPYKVLGLQQDASNSDIVKSQINYHKFYIITSKAEIGLQLPHLQANLTFLLVIMILPIYILKET